MSTCLLLPERSATRSVTRAVKEYIDHSRIHRSDTYNWDEYEELMFNRYGYLKYAIDDVRIDEIMYIYGTQTFYVIASMYAGERLDIPIGDDDIYEAWQDDNEEWIIEWHGC